MAPRSNVLFSGCVTCCNSRRKNRTCQCDQKKNPSSKFSRQKDIQLISIAVMIALSASTNLHDSGFEFWNMLWRPRGTNRKNPPSQPRGPLNLNGKCGCYTKLLLVPRFCKPDSCIDNHLCFVVVVNNCVPSVLSTNSGHEYWVCSVDRELHARFKMARRYNPWYNHISLSSAFIPRPQGPGHRMLDQKFRTNMQKSVPPPPDENPKILDKKFELGVRESGYNLAGTAGLCACAAIQIR